MFTLLLRAVLLKDIKTKLTTTWTPDQIAKQKKYDEALNEVAFVRGSDLRIGDFWDDAAKEAQKLEKQIRDG